MLSGVKCTVASCRYWNSGQHCDAPSIEVNNEAGGQDAQRSEETICQTFIPKSR